MWLKSLINNKRLILLTLLFLVMGVGVRTYGLATPPQYYDIITFQAWGEHIAKVGAANFYATTWSDYMPFPLYGLGLIATLTKSLAAPFAVVFKATTTILEVLLIITIAKAWPSSKKLLLLSLLLLSPALIGDTAFWGQIDTIPALLTVLSLTLLLKANPKIVSASLVFGLAVAIKPIMLVVAPVLWIIAIKNRQTWQFPVISGLTFFATGYPMAGLKSPALLWSRAIEQATTYPYTTINAWNVWSLVPHPFSWPPDDQIILGLSLHTLGLIFFTGTALSILNLWRKHDFTPKSALRVAATLLICFYAFTTRMHERHLLFGLPLLSLAVISETWLMIPLTLITTCFTLNLWAAYYWVDHAQTWPLSPSVTSTLSWIITLVALGLAMVWDWRLMLKSFLSRINAHKLLVLILLLASLLRLINLGHPDTYIFDEVYHAFTAREYLHNHIEAWEWWTHPPEGVAYEWTHPPLAKYGMVAGMFLFGENSFGWRVGSAVAGIVCILGIYLLTLALTKSDTTAHLAAFLVAIEGLHIAQSRIGMNDMYMLVFFVWSLYCAVKSRWKWAAILYGLSLASKWSAMYGIVPLAIIYLYQNPLHTWRLKTGVLHLLSIIRLSLIVLSVYVLSFTPFIVAGHTWAQWWELHRQMWYYHTHLVATHAYQSTPKEWIFDARPVWYFVKYAPTTIANIYAFGNPLILWLGLAALILHIKNSLKFPGSIFYVLYAIFTLPWVFSPRIMFFYHYLPSATFLCIILATWLADLSPRVRNSLLACCLVSLFLISPMLYGFPMPHTYWNTLFKIFPSWK